MISPHFTFTLTVEDAVPRTPFRPWITSLSRYPLTTSFPTDVESKQVEVTGYRLYRQSLTDSHISMCKSVGSSIDKISLDEGLLTMFTCLFRFFPCFSPVQELGHPFLFFYGFREPHPLRHDSYKRVLYARFLFHFRRMKCVHEPKNKIIVHYDGGYFWSFTVMSIPVQKSLRGFYEELRSK